MDFGPERCQRASKYPPIPSRNTRGFNPTPRGHPHVTGSVPCLYIAIRASDQANSEKNFTKNFPETACVTDLSPKTGLPANAQTACRALAQFDPALLDVAMAGCAIAVLTVPVASLRAIVAPVT